MQQKPFSGKFIEIHTIFKKRERAKINKLPLQPQIIRKNKLYC